MLTSDNCSLELYEQFKCHLIVFINDKIIKMKHPNLVQHTKQRFELMNVDKTIP